VTAEQSNRDWQALVQRSARRIGRVVVGDRTGLLVFVSVLIWAIALWRIGFFIRDSVTVANALANVAEGRLAIVESPYALTLGSQPGLVTVDGTPYGRNYGHVLLSLPVLWALDGLALVADLRLAVAAGWSLLVMILGWQLGRLTDRDWIVVACSVVALFAFLGNVLTVEPLPAERRALMALQITTMLAAGLLATTIYRLIALFHDRRVGVTAGLAVVFATPLGFWASIPKRHVLTATVAIVVLYCFAVSRSDASMRGKLARATAYASVGFLTTIHPFEAFFLFAVLVPLDLLTAPTNGVRSLGLVGVAFGLSLIPFFLINNAISGNPLQSPRFLSGYGSGIDIPTDIGGGGETPRGETPDRTPPGTETGTPSTPANETVDPPSGEDQAPTAPDEDGGGIPLIGFVVGLIGTAFGFASSVASFAWEWLNDGLAVLENVDRMYHILVRSGDIPMASLSINDYEAVELTLLESFPLVAAFVTLPAVALYRARTRIDRSVLSSPRRQTDLLAVAFAVVFTLVYLPRLPLVSQITLRYILPVFPLLLYAVARLPAVHRCIDETPKWLYGGYLAVVVVGGAAVVLALAAIDPAIGEAMQFHALLGLASVVGAGICLGTGPFHEDSRVLAVGLALPAGVTTVFLLLSGIEYFRYRLPGTAPGQEPFALDIVRVLAELLPIFPA
jgi:hypothetical protein